MVGRHGRSEAGGQTLGDSTSKTASTCRAPAVAGDLPGVDAFVLVWVHVFPFYQGGATSTHLMKDCDYADRSWLCGRALLQVDVLRW